MKDMDSSAGSNNCDGCGGGCLFGAKAPIQTVSSNAFVKTSGDATNGAAVAPSAFMDDAMLAKELNELSFEEREKVFDDIHGVADSVPETPELIQQRIKELDTEIEALPKPKKATLTRAIFLKPSIETDAKFKLMFLRADDYDAFKAARRMARYFEHKAKLWGEDKLVKKITLDDFDKNDMELFQRGPFILPPLKDAVGRSIWLTNLPKFDFTQPENLIRCCWYATMKSLEDEASQIKGVCNIIYCPSDTQFNMPISQILRFLIGSGEVQRSLPVRDASSHFCYDNATMEVFLSGFRRSYGKGNRLRMSPHYGSGIEIQYKLMTYGIKLPFLLSDDTERGGRDAKMEMHERFIQEQLRLGQQERRQQAQFYQDTINFENRKKGNRLVIPYPNSKDVLVGRGRPYQTYSGNIMLSDLVEQKFLDRHGQADQLEKTCIYIEIVKQIQDVIGGRFIQRTSDGWEVVEDEVARRKVSSCFRSKTAKHPTPSNVGSKSKDPVKTGQKIKQRSIMPLPTTSKQHDFYNNFNNSLYSMAFGGGSAKRARYDPSVLVHGNGNCRNDGTPLH